MDLLHLGSKFLGPQTLAVIQMCCACKRGFVWTCSAREVENMP